MPPCTLPQEHLNELLKATVEHVGNNRDCVMETIVILKNEFPTLAGRLTVVEDKWIAENERIQTDLREKISNLCR